MISPRLPAEFAYPPTAEVPQHVGSFADMLRDPVVRAALDEIESTALQTRPEAVNELGERFLTDVRLAFSTNTLRHLLHAYARGFSALALTWAFNESERRQQLVAVQPLDTEATGLLFESDGTLVGVRYQTASTTTSRLRPHALVHRHRPTDQAPAGRSQLSVAYRPWRAKDLALRYWGQSLKRYGIPLVILKTPSSMTNAEQSALAEAVYDMVGDGVLAISNTIEYEVHNPAYGQTITVAEACHYLDNQIVFALTHRLQSGFVTSDTQVTGAGLQALRGGSAALIQYLQQELLETVDDQLASTWRHLHGIPPDFPLVQWPALMPDSPEEKAEPNE